MNKCLCFFFRKELLQFPTQKKATMSKAKVFVSKPIPLGGLRRLRETCDVNHREDESPIPVDEFKKSIQGMDALFIHPPAPINKETLDIAGYWVK